MYPLGARESRVRELDPGSLRFTAAPIRSGHSNLHNYPLSKECYPYHMARTIFTSVVTSKGQITVPQEIRTRLGLKQGDRIEFVAGAKQTIVRRAKAAENPFTKFAGVLGPFPGGRDGINAWVRDLRDDTE